MVRFHRELARDLLCLYFLLHYSGTDGGEEVSDDGVAVARSLFCAASSCFPDEA